MYMRDLHQHAREKLRPRLPAMPVVQVSATASDDAHVRSLSAVWVSPTPGGTRPLPRATPSQPDSDTVAQEQELRDNLSSPSNALPTNPTDLDPPSRESYLPLPSPPPIPNPSFRWSDYDAATIMQSMNEAYSEVVHWHSNTFKVPYGNAG